MSEHEIYLYLIGVAILLIVAGGTVFWMLQPARITEKYDSGETRKTYRVKNGQRVGKETAFYRDGCINRIKQYKLGKVHGQAITFYPSGKKYIETHYEHGVLAGDYRIFEEDGTIKENRHY